MSAPGANWKNVNNWHWIEKDVTAWAHERLRALLSALPNVASVTSVEGDVSVAVRKGRLRHIFDLAVALVLTEPANASARVVDYMSDTERAALEVVFAPHGAVSPEQQERFKNCLWDAFTAFRSEIDTVHGASLLVSALRADGSAPADGPTFLADASPVTAPSSASPVDTGSLAESVRMPVPPAVVFDAFTRPSAIAAWSRGTARGLESVRGERIAPGDTFSLFGGNIACVVTSVATGEAHAVAMEWRLRAWARPSTVSVRFAGDAAGGCVVQLAQTGIPAAERDAVRENWHRYYWEPLRVLLGCPSAPLAD